MMSFLKICSIVGLAIILNACDGPNNKTKNRSAAPQSPTSDEGGGNGNGGADFVNDTELEFLPHSNNDPVYLHLQEVYVSSKDIQPCEENFFLKEAFELYASPHQNGNRRATSMLVLIARNTLGCLGYSVKTFPGEARSAISLADYKNIFDGIQYPGSGKRTSMRVAGNINYENVSISDGEFVDETLGTKISYYSVFEYVHIFRLTPRNNVIVRTEVFLRHTNGLNHVDRFYTLLKKNPPIQFLNTDFLFGTE